MSAALTQELRGLLAERQRRAGPKITVDLGCWRDRWIAVGRPNRLTPAASAGIGEGLRALVAAHRPEWVALVGPAAAPAGSLRVGEVARGVGAARSRGGEPIAIAHMQPGPVEPGAIDTAAAGWIHDASAAAESCGVDCDFLCVVTRVAPPGESARAPAWRPRTASRSLGGWVGRLLGPGGEDPEAAARRRGGRALCEALAALLARRTRGR